MSQSRSYVHEPTPSDQDRVNQSFKVPVVFSREDPRGSTPLQHNMSQVTEDRTLRDLVKMTPPSVFGTIDNPMDQSEQNPYNN